MEKIKYPPTPWQLIEEYPAGHYIADANGVGISSQMDRNIKNHVIKCVNCHDELIDALKANAVRFPMEFKTTTKDCTCNQFIDTNNCRHVMALKALKKADVYFGD